MKSLIDTIWLSEKRRQLMLLLKDKPQRIEDLKAQLDTSSRTIMPSIKTLIKHDLVVEENEVFRLSNIGELMLERMMKIIDLETLLDKDRKYWKDRKLSSLPSHLYETIDSLKNCFVYEHDIDDMFEYPPQFSSAMSRSGSYLTVHS